MSASATAMPGADLAAGDPAPPRLLLDGGAELRETHISWVFLAGARAYKIKKPIVLPFLDYGTAARRHAMCRAEIDLNRRLAPDVYLGVRALVPADGGLRLRDEDDPAAVDYAVEMRRYDEADTLAMRLRSGAVGVEDAAAIGARLAAFHATAAVCPGGAEPVKRALDDNFATLHALAADRAAVARAERSAGALLAGVWEELEARAAAGLVRHGHGDLRLEHVLLGEEVQIVDCVEFEPALRQIDVAADLAFLVMELREAGRADLADALVHAYRAAGGDPGSDALLAFFAAYRAEVRAKVALLRAGQSANDADQLQLRHAAELMALATRLRWTAQAPLVIAVAGIAASGKSTVAAALAEASGFAYAASDIVRKRRAGLEPADRGPERLYTPEARRETYAALGRMAAAQAGGVIVDATFHRREERAAFRTALGDGAPVLFVECRAPAALLEARARARAARGDSPSDAGVQVVRRQLAAADPLDDVAAPDHVIVRSDRPVAAIVAEIADAIDRRALGSVVSPSRTGNSPSVAATSG